LALWRLHLLLLVLLVLVALLVAWAWARIVACQSLAQHTCRHGKGECQHTQHRCPASKVLLTTAA
jgi:hypothetical protein